MGHTILLIDDSATVRIQAGRALTQAGFAILEACDGVEGLAHLVAQPDVALIVCDVNMPNMDGIEFVETLAKTTKVLPPILMLTTEGHPQLVQRAKKGGAKGWMVKPFKPELLVAAVRKITSAAEASE
jgi:two-component system, chemotaxis family, chemotaxis protein CheY